MAQKIVEWILSAFGGITSMKFGKELIVFLISLSPILELRGGLLAASLLHMNPVESYIIAFLGNLLPVPFILWFMSSILKWMRNSKHFYEAVNWLDKKGDKKKSQIEKYGFWGIVLFVGIPLPGTGAWTGCLVASVLEMDKKKAFLATLVGLFMASIIMMLLSFGLLQRIVG